MANLEDLVIYTKDLREDFLPKLFSNTTQLEKVFIGVKREFSSGNMCEWIQAAHKNNENLTSLVINTGPDAHDQVYDLLSSG